MNGKKEVIPGNMPQLCKRCGVHEGYIHARQDLVCKECFIKFVNTKIIKRMEAFRVRNSTLSKQRRMLLPISGGISSAILLHVLNSHLETQIARVGRSGFELHVVHVVSDANDQEEDDTNTSLLDTLKTRYPRHHYHQTKLIDADGEGEDNQSAQQRNLPILETLLNMTKLSRTSAVDIHTIALTRAITRTARLHNCEGILFSSTTTRLAETVLAETAKGRGYSLAYLVNDGPSPFGMDFLYPMKDLLKKELFPYAEIIGEGMAFDVLEAEKKDEEGGHREGKVREKDTSIDSLMREYFRSVEENFPSIVANVVRTTSKLNLPVDGEGLSSKACKLCGMPVAEGTFGIHGWGGYRTEDELDIGPADHETGLCYGCARSTLGAIQT